MDDLGYSYPPDSRQEHRTTRVANTYLIDEVREYGKTLRVSGEAIQNIREESRRIYMQDGVPGIFFDLEDSVTFLQMCKTKNAIKIEQYLFTPEDLNLDISINENINDSIQKFQDNVSTIYEKQKSNNSVDFGSVAHVLAGSKTILEDLKYLVHNQGFLVQQNRDLYREMCEHLCREMRESEHATYIRTKLREDLNRALDADDYGIGYGVNEKTLAGVMTQIISTLQTHDKLEIDRAYNKKYRQYTRNIVKTARDEMKKNIKDVWRANQGDDVAIVRRRTTTLKNIEKHFHEITDWERMKFDYESMNGVGVQTLQEFERKLKETKEKNESEEQVQKDKIQNRHEEYRRNEQEKEKNEAWERANRLKDAKKSVVANYRSTDKGYFDKRYTEFVRFLKTKYKENIIENSMQRNLANKCENICVNEIISFLNNPLSVPFIREDVRKSMQNMHEKIVNEMLQGNLHVAREDQEYIKSYFDSRVYEKINAFEFQEADATKREIRIQKRNIIVDEFHIIMKNHMDKYDELGDSFTSLSNSNYNPYVI